MMIVYKAVNRYYVMSKPLGGRGKVAPYQTTHIRVPIPIKAEIEQMIERYRLSIVDDIETQEDEILSLEDAKNLAKKLLRSKTAKVDTITKLLTGIYKIEVSKTDLE